MDTDIETTNKDSDLKDSFKDFQNQTNARFCNIEHSFRQIADSISTLHKPIMELSSAKTSFNKIRLKNYNPAETNIIKKMIKALPIHPKKKRLMILPLKMFKSQLIRTPT